MTEPFDLFVKSLSKAVISIVLGVFIMIIDDAFRSHFGVRSRVIFVMMNHRSP